MILKLMPLIHIHIYIFYNIFYNIKKKKKKKILKFTIIFKKNIQ